MKKNGFTLVELMIYVAVSAVIMAAAYAAVVMAQRSSSSVGRKIITQQDVRLVLDMMAMDIRNASYNPTHKGGIWRDQNNLPLPMVIGINGDLIDGNKLYGIQFANANNILVEMDLGGLPGVPSLPDGIIGGPTGPNEAIYYKYNIPLNSITRASNFGPDNALFGGAGTGTLVTNNAAGVPLFQYFDNINPNNPLDPATLSVYTINNTIRRIRITIVADTEAKDSLTNIPKRMIYTTDVLVKNHPLAQLIN